MIVRGLKKIVRSGLYRYRHRLPLAAQRKYFKCVTLLPSGPVKGRVLVSYALSSAGLPEDHPMFAYHTGPWESNQIIRLFLKYGFIVDCIHYTNKTFVPRENYDIIFACTGELYRLVAQAPSFSRVIKIWHSVISAVTYNNAAEISRIRELSKRRPGVLYFPKRQEPHENIQAELMNLADYCVLIGNQHVQSTFPKDFHHKITRVTVSASPLTYIKTANDFVPPTREFLWYFGNGAVRKGLDLLLEIFPRHPEWTLNIIGLVDQEPDFIKIYHKELYETPNIIFHGYLNPGSDHFNRVIKRCFAFIAPTATESISTAVVTIMRAGLYPLISRDTGVDLPPDAGIYLEDQSISGLEREIAKAIGKNQAVLATEIVKTQALALRDFSRNKFLADMGFFIRRVLRENNFI